MNWSVSRFAVLQFSAQPCGEAGASNERGPVEHGEGGRARARLRGVQRAGGEQAVVRGIDYGHRRVLLSGEPADVRGVFDAAVDGKSFGAVELVVQKPVAI